MNNWHESIRVLHVDIVLASTDNVGSFVSKLTYSRVFAISDVAQSIHKPRAAV